MFNELVDEAVKCFSDELSIFKNAELYSAIVFNADTDANRCGFSLGALHFESDLVVFVNLVHLDPFGDKKVLVHNIFSGEIFQRIEVKRERLSDSNNSLKVLMLAHHRPALVTRHSFMAVPSRSSSFSIHRVNGRVTSNNLDIQDILTFLRPSLQFNLEDVLSLDQRRIKDIQLAFRVDIVYLFRTFLSDIYTLVAVGLLILSLYLL
jgi:hypothetical protein